MDMEPIGISFVKPPRLTDGNFNRWKIRFENFCRSTNYQCWKVIMKGDLKVPEDKKDKEDEWGPDEFKLMETNAKAICFLQASLCERDAIRVSNLTTAKEQWEALEKYHIGTAEMKEDVKLEIKKEFYAFRMLPNESVKDYSSRFEALVTKMRNLGIPEAEVSMRNRVGIVIDGLTGKWNFDRTTFKENTANKTLDMEEIYGKLRGYEARREADLAELARNPQTDIALMTSTPEYAEYLRRQQELAMMVEANKNENREKMRVQAVKERESKSKEQLEEEEGLVLFNKVLRSFGKRSKHFNKHKMPKKEGPKYTEAEMKELTCFKCNKKGHFAKKCTTGMSSKDMKTKALIGAFASAWDNMSSDDEEPDEEEAYIALEDAFENDQVAFMAMEDATVDEEDAPKSENEVTRESMMKSLESCSKTKLIKLIGKIMEESVIMQKRMDELELENENIVVECENCSTMSIQLESSCEEVKSLKTEVMCLKLENANLRDEIKVLGKSPVVEEVRPMMFVPAKRGLGYESDSKNSLPSDFEASKSTELEQEREKTRNLLDRIRVLESGEKGEEDYYTNSTGHRIYKKIAKEEGSKVCNPQKMKQNRIQRPNKKYYLGTYYRTCWYCGQGDHYKYECLKLKEDIEKGKAARTNIENDKSVPKTKSRRSRRSRSSFRRYATSNDVNINDYMPEPEFYFCNEPGKEHLAWVAKN